MGHPVARLVAGEAPTAWARPLLAEPTAEAEGVVQVFVVLELDGEWLESTTETPPGTDDPEWRAVDARLDGAATELEDVRDPSGALVELRGGSAGALTSKRFRKAALKRLGATEALAVSPDGAALRLRDAWRQPVSGQVAALVDDRLPGTKALWVFDENSVHSAVIGDTRVDAWGKVHPFIDEAPGGDPAVVRDQIIFARALLGFLGGLVLAAVLAAAIKLS